MNAKNLDMRVQVLTAAVELASSGRWSQISLSDIARAADIDLSELRALFPNKSAILAAYFADIDRRVLSQDFGFEAEDTPRDRLFEILMSRFDALTPHRMAVDAFSRYLPADPIGALCLFPTALTSMIWMLEAAGIMSSGPFGLLRAKGLLAVWLTTERVWLGDDSPDLGPTMAALDRNLRRAEKFAIQLDRFGRADSAKFSDECGLSAPPETD